MALVVAGGTVVWASTSVVSSQEGAATDDQSELQLDGLVRDAALAEDLLGIPADEVLLQVRLAPLVQDLKSRVLASDARDGFGGVSLTYESPGVVVRMVYGAERVERILDEPDLGELAPYVRLEDAEYSSQSWNTPSSLFMAVPFRAR